VYGVICVSSALFRPQYKALLYGFSTHSELRRTLQYNLMDMDLKNNNGSMKGYLFIPKLCPQIIPRSFSVDMSMHFFRVLQLLLIHLNCGFRHSCTRSLTACSLCRLQSSTICPSASHRHPDRPLTTFWWNWSKETSTTTQYCIRKSCSSIIKVQALCSCSNTMLQNSETLP